MAGFDNDVVYGINADYSNTLAGTGASTIGQLLTNGQLWIGTTALNAGGTHINVGALTSPSGTITIGYSSPNITLEIAGSSQAVEHLTGDTGGQLNPDVSHNFNLLSSVVVAGTTPFTIAGSGSTLTHQIQISQAIAAADATKIGLSNFDSTSFSVAATGFVTLKGGGFAWNDVSGAFSPLKNNGYFITATATGTLPAAPVQGDTIEFFVDHATQLLTIQASPGQTIRMGSLASSVAGTWVSTLQGDACELVYRAANTTWQCVDMIGTWVKT